MNVDFSQIENLLVSEIKLSPIQARIFLLVVTHGRMNAENIATHLEISTDEASDNSKKLPINSMSWTSISLGLLGVFWVLNFVC